MIPGRVCRSEPGRTQRSHTKWFSAVVAHTDTLRALRRLRAFLSREKTDFAVQLAAQSSVSRAAASTKMPVHELLRLRARRR